MLSGWGEGDCRSIDGGRASRGSVRLERVFPWFAWLPLVLLPLKVHHSSPMGSLMKTACGPHASSFYLSSDDGHASDSDDAPNDDEWEESGPRQ